jgi:hypothetical protein
MQIQTAIQLLRILPVRDRTSEFYLLAVADRADEEKGTAAVEIWNLNVDAGDSVDVGTGVENERAEVRS